MESYSKCRRDHSFTLTSQWAAVLVPKPRLLWSSPRRISPAYVVIFDQPLWFLECCCVIFTELCCYGNQMSDVMRRVDISLCPFEEIFAEIQETEDWTNDWPLERDDEEHDNDNVCQCSDCCCHGRLKREGRMSSFSILVKFVTEIKVNIKWASHGDRDRETCLIFYCTWSRAQKHPCFEETQKRRTEVSGEMNDLLL